MAIIRGNPVKHWLKINDQGDVFIDQNLVPGGMSALDGYFVSGTSTDLEIGDLQVTGTDIHSGSAASLLHLVGGSLNDGASISLTGSTFSAPTYNTQIFYDAIKHTFENLVGSVVIMTLHEDGSVYIPNMKSGTDQADAGASAGELYFDTNDDNTVKMGV